MQGYSVEIDICLGIESCVVLSDGILYGVAGIDVVVNSSEIRSGIKARYVDAHVAGDKLACQRQQVRTLQMLIFESQNNLKLCTADAF